MDAALCDEIAVIRRKLQRIKEGHVFFLDETALRVNEAPTHTIVLPEQQPYVIVEDTTAYAKRFDMIACCSVKETLPPIIYSPNERRKGIDTEMLLAYIRDFLAQSMGALDRYPITLVLDRSTIHNTEKMMQAFHDWGCQELVEIIKMPAQSAKRLSPLDNALFHDWKQHCRNSEVITSDSIRRVMNNQWSNINPSLLRAHYSHCLLLPRQNPYADCPDPAGHRHAR